MPKNKFDNRICNDCYYFWSSITGNECCHKQGKHIYDGECIEYKPSLRKLEEDYILEDMQAAYDAFMNEWN